MSSVARSVARLGQAARVTFPCKQIYLKNTHDSSAVASVFVNSCCRCCCFCCCNPTIRAQSEQTEVDKLNLQIKEVETCLNNSRMPSLGCQQQQQQTHQQLLQHNCCGSSNGIRKKKQTAATIKIYYHFYCLHIFVSAFRTSAPACCFRLAATCLHTRAAEKTPSNS